MQLLLTRLPGTTHGIYTTQSNGPNSLPTRFLGLHPKAAAGFAALESGTGGLIYSDILRSAEESLQAMQQKTGVQPPSYSGHNFGFSFDVAVDATLKLRGWTYDQLLGELSQHGWHCHRRDRAGGGESWHFNFFGDDAPAYLAKADPAHPITWAQPLELLIQDTYGTQLVLNSIELQTALQKMKMYNGPLDGDIGPMSRQAIQAFQRAWRLHETGTADGSTQRTLAFVTADITWA